MAAIVVTNDFEGWLAVWIEPLGEDRWLRPDERMTIRSDYTGQEPAFTVQYWANACDRAAGIENVTIWINEGNCYPEVVDGEGLVVECGHQRPDVIALRRQAHPSHACPA
ncbi:hypothetical protein Cs7R123_47400 [Catellatospora sp. TT07R-123]|uniref:hypothetical protein n=1 Tax=Catellatospora sp. TT07R-123 TaxID=2733863 RepID=UPI001B2B0274|nr:hypothetical protein [Catellatospora sp. TT07R-123]GHJ47398.1 hypothetical protein Cs7R123_47400 [Catellatospora sp. TT07R-123]